MKWRKYFVASWRGALAGALLCAFVGLAFIATGLGVEMVHLSYDLLFRLRLRPGAVPPDLLIVQMDDHSLFELKQKSAAYWDLNEHAALLSRLRQAQVVVFDVLFTSPAPDSARTNFAAAIRRHGRVVLAAGYDLEARPGMQSKGPVMPAEELTDAAAAWGVAEVLGPRGGIARQYFRGTENVPSLPWAAAKVAGLRISSRPGARQPDWWLNYYGPAKTLRSIRYSDVERQPPEFFSGKYVFVGALPKTLKAFDEADVFRTPLSLWGGEYFPGVEIGATAFLNLLREDGLALLPWSKQSLLIVILGAIFGAAMGVTRPMPACVVAVIGLVGLLVATSQAAQNNYWFGWTIVALVQIPIGLGWSLRSHFIHLRLEKEKLEWKLSEATRREEASRLAPQVAAAVAAPPKAPSDEIIIPDHTMVRRVGKGAYGEVWLARNAIGAFHAVKIVRRRGFPADEPYEREFRGIQKFMPISRSHPGLVHVLHVGRNDTVKFFFYIMEAGDDVTSGQEINPDTYTPKTLATEMESRGMLPPKECLRLALALTLALDHLHQQKLIHRDIKPANIIYVNDQPKFADIGLVTDIRGDGRDVSYLGTEGYLAPEGPGTASADVFALGKVLYEACMGRDRCLFPEIPTSVLEAPSDSLVRQLNRVIFKACELAANERYQTAAEMHEDLRKLEPLAARASL